MIWGRARPLPRSAGPVAVLLVLALLSARPAAAQTEPTPSPCRALARISLSTKLVCPFDGVQVRIQVQASCPAEPEGPAELRSIRVIHRLPSGLISVEGGTGLPGPSGMGLVWRVDTPPGDGITVTHAVRPIRPGPIRVDGGIEIELEDSRGRRATEALRPEGDAGLLSVSDRCPADRFGQVFLPWLVQPLCPPDPRPADIVLLVDRSTSMGAQGLFGAGRHSRALIDAMAPGRNRVAILGFDQTVDLVAPLGSSRAALLAALDGLRLAAGTSLERAIEAGAAHLGDSAGPPGRRRLLVLLSDGVQTGPRGSEAVLAAAEQARDRGIGIVTVALGPAPDLELMRRLSDTPAQALVAAAPEALARALPALGDTVACAR